MKLGRWHEKVEKLRRMVALIPVLITVKRQFPDATKFFPDKNFLTALFYVEGAGLEIKYLTFIKITPANYYIAKLNPLKEYLELARLRFEQTDGVRAGERLVTYFGLIRRITQNSQIKLQRWALIISKSCLNSILEQLLKLRVTVVSTEPLQYKVVNASGVPKRFLDRDQGKRIVTNF